jgi:hypothetical protein
MKMSKKFLILSTALILSSASAFAGTPQGDDSTAKVGENKHETCPANQGAISQAPPKGDTTGIPAAPAKPLSGKADVNT